MELPPLALTMGEPAGIGGEIALAAWRRLAGQGPVFLALDDPERLRRIGTAPVREIADAGEAAAVFPHALPVLPLGERVEVEPGRPDPAQAAAVVQSIVRAVSLTRAGAAAAVVTNPIHKATLYAAGFGFPGHTEFLAELSGSTLPVMMLAGPSLRVVPLTVHIALAEVPRRLDQDGILAQARIVAEALRHDFGITAPRLAVAALNPHAGEEGAMGDEESRIITPALDRLRGEGIDVTGPLPADTMFHPRARAAYDAALCMYHDQALVPVKTLHFDDAVNVTLGLPFVRTSPDHGTALGIAGRGVARPDSLIAAIELAAAMARRRRETAA
ncbi:MAG: 4-hydroxythreonine-4-phosphate dehydrogenase PdxA [Geminicoccaceae bacterium]